MRTISALNNGETCIGAFELDGTGDASLCVINEGGKVTKYATFESEDAAIRFMEKLVRYIDEEVDENNGAYI